MCSGPTVNLFTCPCCGKSRALIYQTAHGECSECVDAGMVWSGDGYRQQVRQQNREAKAALREREKDEQN